eukprot:TRINITY_DN17773_c0_g1_i2.p1 TRINITY_DN17773_c0_g1~~TRINITY_DN17773_c0_g1_i2.p1  ORF type:complete len:498 (+),score=142.66 TRINITY_DN17773_c0_g1_i2:144-1637(+)
MASELEGLIRHFLGNDNDARKQAEAMYTAACKTAEGKTQIAQQLLGLLRSSPHEEIRSMCAVLLRKLLTRSENPFWKSLPEIALTVIQTELITSVETETTNHVRNKVCDTLSTLASSMLTNSVAWPQLLPKLFEWAGGEASARKASMTIFGELALGMGRNAAPFFPQVRDILLANLGASQTAEVREAALTASAKFVVLLESQQERDFFGTLLSPMLQCIGDFLSATDEVAARKGMQLFIEVAEHDRVAFFKPGIMPILQAMVQIASTEELEDDTKHLSLEFVLTLLEAKPGMVRKKMPQLVERVFQIALTWMLEVEDTKVWVVGAMADSNADDVTAYDVGLEAMDRIAIAIGGKTLLPFAFAPSQIPGYLQDQRWQARHAALMVISQISEGCKKAISAQLGEIVSMVIKYFQDPHPRVRYAAINCIGQIASDFSPELQHNYHNIGLPALVTAMGDATSRQVQGHAASCIINFAEGMEKDVMQQYAPGIVLQLSLIHI